MVTLCGGVLERGKPGEEETRVNIIIIVMMVTMMMVIASDFYKGLIKAKNRELF